MKKLLLISVLVCFAGLQLFASNPIPSYNVLVQDRASFQETPPPFIGNVPKDEKRQMNIETTSSSGGSAALGASIVIVNVYRLDGRGSMGPYYLICGQSLSVFVDDKSWGVNVMANDPTLVSVWAN